MDACLPADGSGPLIQNAEFLSVHKRKQMSVRAVLFRIRLATAETARQRVGTRGAAWDDHDSGRHGGALFLLLSCQLFP